MVKKALVILVVVVFAGMSLVSYNHFVAKTPKAESFAEL